MYSPRVTKTPYANNTEGSLKLYKRIIQHIPSEQFGFVKGSNTLDAGLSLASTIISALNRRAEVRLVALDILTMFAGKVFWPIYGA